MGSPKTSKKNQKGGIKREGAKKRGANQGKIWEKKGFTEKRKIRRASQ